MQNQKLEQKGRTESRAVSRHNLPGPTQIYGAALTVALSVVISGCVIPRPLKGGKALTARLTTGSVEQSLMQGDNAAQQSRQTQDSLRVRTYTLPAGARMEDASVVSSGSGALTNLHSIVLNQPMPITEREETRAASELGAAQKDTARELGARLASLRGVTWLGAGLFVFGLLSLVWPPLKLVIGSVTTSAAIVVGGMSLMILPTLIAGNEGLILGGVALTAGAWFLAHRHGHLRGQLSANTQPAGQPSSQNPAVSGSKPN